MTELERIALPAHAWYEELPASPAVRAGDLLFIAGQVGVDAHRQIIGRGDVARQARLALEYMRELVQQAGGTMDDIVSVVSLHKDVREIQAVWDVARDFFPTSPPAWTAAGYLGSYTSDILVTIRATAHLGPESKECFTPDFAGWLRDLPASAACKKGNLVFIAGQTGAEPDGHVPLPADHHEQARKAYGRITELVGLAGGEVGDILDFTSFHQDIRGAEPTLLQDYAPMMLDGIDADHVASTSHLGSPGLFRAGMLGAYGALADLAPGRRVASTPESIWWKGVLPVAGAAKKERGQLITVAGQVASDPTGDVFAPGDIVAQANYIFTSMAETLDGFGASMADVVEVSSFHKDPRAWETAMEIGADYFDRGDPAWTPAAMPGLWVEGFLHEIAALAVVDAGE